MKGKVGVKISFGERVWMGVAGGVVLGLAIYMRLLHVGLNFFQDEVYTLLATQGVLQHGLPVMPSGLVYVRAFPMTYLAAAFSYVVQPPEIAVRGAAILVGLLSLLFIQCVVQRKFDYWHGLIAAAVVAISPWHAFYSLFARSFLAQSLCFAVILYLWIRYIQSQKTGYLLWSCVIALLVAMLSPVSVLLVPVMICMLGYVGRRRIIATTEMGLIMVCMIILCAGLVLPPVVAPWKMFSYGSDFIVPSLFFFKFLLANVPILFLVNVMAFIDYGRKRDEHVIFPMFTLLSITILSVFNPFGNLQPRYVANFIVPMFLTAAIWLPHFLDQIAAAFPSRSKKGHKARWLLAGYVVLMLATVDLPRLPEYLRLNYGQPTTGTIQVSSSWLTFPDISSHVKVLNNRYSDGDIVVSLQPRGQTEAYTTVPIDYYLRTRNYENETHLNVNNIRVDDYSAIPVLSSAAQFGHVIREAQSEDRTIWVVSSASEKLSLDHIDLATYNHLIENFTVVYTGRDNESKLYQLH